MKEIAIEQIPTFKVYLDCVDNSGNRIVLGVDFAAMPDITLTCDYDGSKTINIAGKCTKLPCPHKDSQYKPEDVNPHGIDDLLTI